MSETTIAVNTVWSDRWAPPTADDLMAALVEPASLVIPKLLAAAYDNVADLQQEVIWHGSSWRWTLQFTAPCTLPGCDERDILFYFVPNPNEPLICMPLRPEHLQFMPIRRLNRYVRDGIRSAKWAVDVRWGKWTPTANTEIEHLGDLIKRKGKILIGESPSQKRAAKKAAE